MSNDQMSLDGILSDEKPEPAAPAEPVAAPKDPVEATIAANNAPEPKPAVDRPQSRKSAWRDKEQDAQGRIRDPETGQFVAKDATPDTPAAPAVPAAPAAATPAPAAPAPQQEFTEKEKAFLRAAQEERGKRQELERRLAAVEAAKPKEPEKQFWDDPEGAMKAHAAQIQQVAVNTRIQTAEMITRAAHPDFDEKLAVFVELLKVAPQLVGQVMQQPNPAEAVYTRAKNHMELQAAGDLPAMKAKIEKETEARLRTQIEAELKAKADAMAKERAALPGSLSDARSSGSSGRPVWGGPTALEDILKH